MKKKVTVISFLFCLLCIGILTPGALKQKMSSLHREIGSNLIHIKKQHPAVQSVVFAILDQLGKYHAISRELAQQKEIYKVRLDKEKEKCVSLEKKVSTLESKVEKMKKLVVDASERLQRDSSAIRHFNEERVRFEQEREEFAREKEAFNNAKKQMLEEVAANEKRDLQPEAVESVESGRLDVPDDGVKEALAQNEKKENAAHL